ncbi:MAG TPA: universal stress protein [Thermoanaerobaculia bacterium]|nr:universal stress protein [Thermoanaerobaculia bacterium]
MADIETVLIGTALDEHSEGVVKAGAALARALGAKAHLVHAFAPPMGFAGPLSPEPGLDEYLKLEQDRLRKALEEQARNAGGAETSLEIGTPHRILSDLAERLGAGLLVVGATEGGRIARLLGSTADRVLRRAPCPVLVVRGALPVPPERVVAAVDLSPLSAEAFRRGLGLLRGLGATSAVDVLFVLSVLQRQVAPQFTPEQVDRFAAEELDRFVAAHAGADASGLRRKVRTGNVREEILEELREDHVDLVVLGTHGLGGFDRMAIGSVAADVAREAPCSVLVIPPEGAGQS